MLDDEAFGVAAAARRDDEDDDDDEDERESRELGQEQSVGGEKLAHLGGEADVVLLEHAVGAVARADQRPCDDLEEASL